MTTHRQRESPSEADIRAALATRDAAIVDLALEVRAFVHEVLPDVHEALDTHDGMLGFGARQYGANGWGVAALAVYSRWVSLVFIRGAGLPDPAHLLEGSGKSTRHVKVRSSAEFEGRRGELRELLLAATSGDG